MRQEIGTKRRQDINKTTTNHNKNTNNSTNSKSKRRYKPAKQVTSTTMFDPTATPVTETPNMIQEKLRQFNQEVNNLVSQHHSRQEGGVLVIDDSSSSSSSSCSSSHQEEQEQDSSSSSSAAPSSSFCACQQAETNCPQLVGDDFKLVFLRSESFHVSDAAKLWINYWKKRYEIFGPNYAFLPMTLERGSALDTTTKGDDDNDKDNDLKVITDIIKSCDFHILPNHVTDVKGRGIAVLRFTDRDINQYESNLIIRAVWYMGHMAIQQDNINVQRYGMIFLIKPNMNNMSDFRNFPLQLLTTTFQGIFPLNIARVHIVNPPLIFSAVLDGIQRIVGEKLSNSMIVHPPCRRNRSGDHNVASELSKYGFEKCHLPRIFGGDHDTSSSSSSASSDDDLDTNGHHLPDEKLLATGGGRAKRAGGALLERRKLRVHRRSVTCSAR